MTLPLSSTFLYIQIPEVKYQISKSNIKFDIVLSSVVVVEGFGGGGSQDQEPNTQNQPCLGGGSHYVAKGVSFPGGAMADTAQAAMS